MRLLLAEDEKEMSAALSAILTHSGYDVDAVYDGQAAVEKALSQSYDCMIFDIMMPKKDGVQALKEIRDKGNMTPVIMLTAKGTEYDKVVGLDGGADDYVAKPFGMMELVSRVRALLRRTEPEQRADTCDAGPIHVDLNRHMVTVDGNAVTLTFKEFELLCYLMENKGMVLTRDQLLSKIWGYDFDGETRTVDVHIRTLRQKLGEASRCIETIRGVGYKLEESET